MTSGCPTCAPFDSLTGLPNRRSFLERLEHVIGDARAQRFDLTVLVVDVDRLHKVNDSLGHRVGDKILETVASRLQQSLRRDDTVARSAGDEFLVLLPRSAWSTEVELVARKLLAAIAEPLEIDGYVLHITATIGISVFPGDGLDAESLVQHAAAALHRAKGDGNNRLAHYSSADARPIASPFWRAVCAAPSGAGSSSCTTSRSFTSNQGASPARRRCSAGSIRTSALFRRRVSSAWPRRPGCSSRWPHGPCARHSRKSRDGTNRTSTSDVWP